MLRLAAEPGFGSLNLTAPAAGFPPPQLFRAENLYLFCIREPLQRASNSPKVGFLRNKNTSNALKLSGITRYYAVFGLL
jgi:hypothetical protein